MNELVAQCTTCGTERRQTAAMSHIAIAEKLDEKAVVWVEKVKDVQYQP